MLKMWILDTPCIVPFTISEQLFEIFSGVNIIPV